MTLEKKIQIVMSHPVYPSISGKSAKRSAYGMIHKTKALQLLIFNHSNWTTYRQADFSRSRTDEFQPPLQVFKRSPQKQEPASLHFLKEQAPPGRTRRVPPRSSAAEAHVAAGPSSTNGHISAGMIPEIHL